MKQPLLHDILVIVMASCVAIGLYRQEVRIKMLTCSSNEQETRINMQGERIKTLEDALLLEKENQSAGQPSRGLQENCECPFTKNEENDWVTTDADSLFIFKKGIIIGKKNVGGWDPILARDTPVCNYGSNILSVDQYGNNCPSGDGSVTFGTGNTASGTWSAVVGGHANEASGGTSSIHGGRMNAVSAYAGSISGGIKNIVNGDLGSILGGEDHVLEASAGIISSKCPFTKNEENDWVTTDADSLFIFKKGIVIGKKHVVCTYGNNILSVDLYGNNCPSGHGLVTFGADNTASGEQSTVVGGRYNEASGTASSFSGGWDNRASGFTSSISGGSWNVVSSNAGSISGGSENGVAGDSSSISGGTGNTVSAYAGSISGGATNTVRGSFGSILGGLNHVLEAGAGTVSSKSNFKNATNATAIETIPAHHPEDRIASLEEHSPFDCTAEEGWCTPEHKRFLFSEGVVVGVKNPECKYGTGTLSVDFIGTNCPAHRGSVTFGKKNQMSRAGSFTVR